MYSITLDALTRLQSALNGIYQQTLLRGVLYYNLPVGVGMLLTRSTEQEIIHLQNRIAVLVQRLNEKPCHPADIYAELRVIFHRILVTRDLLASVGIASNPIEHLLTEITPWIPEMEASHDPLV